MSDPRITVGLRNDGEMDTASRRFGIKSRRAWRVPFFLRRGSFQVASTCKYENEHSDARQVFSSEQHRSLVAVRQPVPHGTGIAASSAMSELYIYLRSTSNGIFKIRENSSIYSSNFRPWASS